MRYSLGIVKCALGPEEARDAVGALLAAQRNDAKLFLFTDHELDCHSSVVVTNIDEPRTIALDLRNTALDACANGRTSDFLREGLDLLCLERALGAGRCDCLFMMRHAGTLSDADITWLERNETDFIRQVRAADGATNYLFDCRRGLTRKAISLALDLYRSGALLSLDEPSLARALWLATSVLANGARGRSAIAEP